VDTSRVVLWRLPLKVHQGRVMTLDLRRQKKETKTRMFTMGNIIARQGADQLIVSLGIAASCRKENVADKAIG
jgi:hypothetical protein